MAALPAGVEFGLSSESTYKEGNKEVVFVKLTDSALKAIEDFIKTNKDKLNKPKIQFLPGNEGKFTIPVASSGNGTSGEVTFQFNVNSNMEMEGPQGSFECVRRNGARRLESCGPLPRRMRVQANDDSYVATKDRMVRTVAAEHSKCTRVIKPNQADIGRRVKVRASHHPTLHQSSSSSSYPSNGASLQQQVAERAERDRTERDRAERSDRERPERPSDRTDRPAAPPPAARSQPAQPPHQNHPQHSQQSQHPQQQQRPPPNPDLTRRPIKERLIQLLALKPFKKPELYARIISEGIKDRERSSMNKILTDICALKDNCYHLRRHIWNDVNEDWPFYTEDEKRMLKRRKPQNLTPPLSSDSTNSLSPRASPGGKRPCPGAGEEAPAPVAKKQRISHYRRPSPPSSGYATGSSGASSGERHASDNEDDRTVKKDNGYTLSFNTVKEICPSPVKTNGFRNSPPVEQTNSNNSNTSNSNNTAVKEDSNGVSLDNPELAAAPDENMTDLEDIERQYPPVTTASARRAYKSEFSDLYKEYVALYQIVSQVVDFFTQLEQELNSARPNSQEYQNVKHRIFTEYKRMKNRDYVYQKRRMNYLHRKLNHIKRMVQQYDDMTQRTQSERTTTASTTQAY